MTERCELTELLPDQCGCPKHRGGKTIAEEADADRLALRDRLLGTTNPWFAASWAGTCAKCREHYPAGAAIRRQGFDDGYLAECCADETP